MGCIPLLCAGYARLLVGNALRAYQVSETASSVTEISGVSKGKSDPRQATPKGSRRQLYPREGSGEVSAKRYRPRARVAVTEGNGNAGGENAGRPYREADRRRGVRDQPSHKAAADKLRVQHNPKSSSYARRCLTTGSPARRESSFSIHSVNKQPTCPP